MEIDYDDLVELANCLSLATSHMENVDYEFDDDEEQEEFYSELDRVWCALNKINNML